MNVDEILSIPRKASSYPDYKKDVIEYLKSRFNPSAKVLDVGAGSGIYYDLLNHYFNHIDAVEVYKPLIDEFELDKKYHKIFNCDFIDFDFSFYDIIIMGDVLEHIPTPIAIDLIRKVCKKCTELLVMVPYLLAQPEEGDNKYAKHEQDDLTPEIMSERYPDLKLLFGNNRMGVYVKL